MSIARHFVRLAASFSWCRSAASAIRTKNCLQFCVRSHQTLNESDSKPPKLSEPGHIKIFDEKAIKFRHIVKMKAFIDHSNVIKPILQGGDYKFVVAPSRFCKSTNMEMVRSFLEIEVHKAGKNEGEAIRDVTREATSVEELKGPNLKNYDLFDGASCKILEDKEFVLKHFGRYPVIKLDFVTDTIESYSDAVDHCLNVIHDAYVQHEYLRRSTRLDIKDANGNKDAQDVCEAWCSDKRYKEGDIGTKKQNVRTGLRDLTKFLHSHFGRKVVLLVDEFDAIVSKAKFNVETDKELQRIANLVIEMLGCDLKGTEATEHVQHVLLTGIETISGLGFSSRMAGVKKYMFLEQKEFVGFYGAEENDVRKLVTKLKSEGLLSQLKNKEVDDIMQEIMKYYNGYYSRDKESVSILSLWSVLHYLQKGKPEVHWTRPHVMTYVSSFLKHPSVLAKILQLVGKKPGEETVIVQSPSSVSIPQLRGLVKLDAKREPNVDLCLSYLRELGYLSIVKEPSKELKHGEVELKLANEEIRMELMESLADPTLEVVGFNFTIMQQVGYVFHDILLNLDTSEETETETLHKLLRSLFETLKTLFTEGFAQYNYHNITESAVTALILLSLSKVRDLENLGIECPITDSKGKIVTPTRTRSDIWIKHREHNSLVIFELKYNNYLTYSSYGEQRKRTSLRALREILGKEQSKPGYLSALEVLKPKNYILIGISMDSKFLPSISCLINTCDDKKTICLSETEFTKFPVQYKGCVDLLNNRKKECEE